MPAFDWPHAAAPLPIEPLRGAIDRLTALAARHEGVLELIAPLEVEDESGTAALAGGVAGDPRAYLPPVLARIADEFGGIRVPGGGPELTIVVDERSDLGPYTILTDQVSFTPLYEGDDVAVVLAITPDGAAGPVFAIGEDLALTLVAPDLTDYVQRFTEALDLALVAPAGGDVEVADAELVADRMEESFFAPLFAEDPERAVPLSTRIPSGIEAPAGALAAADLRRAAPGARVEVMDAELPGDPLEIGIAWRDGGFVVVVTGE